MTLPPFGLAVRKARRSWCVLIVHTLYLLSVMHLGWVSFMLKNPTNPVPNELATTAFLFFLTYLTVLLTWIVTVPFFRKVRVDHDFGLLINNLLYKSIGYVSPLKAGHDTQKSKLNFSNEMLVSEVIKDCYYNEVMIVFAILFLWTLSMVLIWPSKALDLFAILASEFGFFGMLLVSFYGAGSATVALLLRAVCLLINAYSKHLGRLGR